MNPLLGHQICWQQLSVFVQMRTIFLRLCSEQPLRARLPTTTRGQDGDCIYFQSSCRLVWGFWGSLDTE